MADSLDLGMQDAAPFPALSPPLPPGRRYVRFNSRPTSSRGRLRPETPSSTWPPLYLPASLLHCCCLCNFENFNSPRRKKTQGESSRGSWYSEYCSVKREKEPARKKGAARDISARPRPSRLNTVNCVRLGNQACRPNAPPPPAPPLIRYHVV